jgi:hypothetical protein
MSHSNFRKHKKDIGKDCRQWEAIQKHWYCFHYSHQEPTTWSDCGQLRRHVNDALLVMNSRQDALLPAPMVISSFMRKVSPNDIASKPFHIDAAIRKEYDSQENRRFADLGYRSMIIKFTQDQVITLKALLAKAGSRPGVNYQAGRSGHRISPQNLKKKCDPALLRTILNEEIQHAVLHYFAGSRELVLYSCEMLYTRPFAPAQRHHADISTRWIKDQRLQVSTIRLLVTALISVDGAATTEIYPRTRVVGTNFHNRPCVRATHDENCVLFDASLVHQGAANNSHEPNLKLCLVFINADACKEHLTVVNKCLGGRSMGLRVADLLAGQPETQTNKHTRELESRPLKRKAEQSALNLTVRRSRRISNEPA